MAKQSNPSWRDPYRNFNFKIKFEGRSEPVAACKKMSKLASSVEVVKFRAGSSASSAPDLLPGRVSYEAVTLEAGLTNDTGFKDWATLLMRSEQTAPPPEGVDFRKTVFIEVYDIDNKTIARKYQLVNAWVSKYTALSDLSGDANEVLIESIQIEYEGFEELPK